MLKRIHVGSAWGRDYDIRWVGEVDEGVFRVVDAAHLA